MIRAHFIQRFNIKGLKGKPSHFDQAQLHLLSDPRHNPRLDFFRAAVSSVPSSEQVLEKRRYNDIQVHIDNEHKGLI